MELNRGQNLEVQKEKILRFIEINGPSLPIHISGHLKIDSLLASAFLSDLLSDKQIKISSLRVGNSPVYYIRGQEFQLEKFCNYLPGKEIEAFNLLREKSVLKDDNLLPAIRVALRSIKDFAVPFEYNDALYWRDVKMGESIAIDMIDEGKAVFSQVSKIVAHPVSKIIPIFEQQKDIDVKEDILPAKIEETKTLEFAEKIEEEKIEPIKKEIIESEVIEPKTKISEIKPIVETETAKEILIAPIMEKKVDKEVDIHGKKDEKDMEEGILNVPKRKYKKHKIKEKSEFELSMDKLFAEDKMFLVEELRVKKKELHGVVRINNENYLFVARDKKIITEADVNSLLKMGKKEKIPILFVCNGHPNPKAEEWLEYLSKVIVFKKLS